ncbi:MAG: hypothetical protein C0483_07645 [Pirellula sp.]|nr:hypothetical protein [Pirellula sp.]
MSQAAMMPGAAHSANDAALAPTLKQVFFAWEKLRVLYVLALAAVTLSSIPLEAMKRLDVWIAVAVLAIAANACYFAGPIAEVYLCWLGLRRNIVRTALFVGGTLFAGLLAYAMLQMPHVAMLVGG